MTAATRYLGVLLCVLWGGCSAPQGDPRRGEALHQTCLGCHGTELYKAPLAKAKTIAELKKQVEIWNDRMNPKLNEQEIEDVTAYLNAEFYKLQ